MGLRNLNPSESGLSLTSQNSVFETQVFSCSLTYLLTSSGTSHDHFILWPIFYWGDDCSKHTVISLHSRTCERDRHTVLCC